jgi:anti-sigma28 factor (negative regulator of flagellin synthesis)
MDVTDNDPRPTSSPLPEGEAISRQRWEEEPSLEPTAAADPDASSSRMKCPSARKLAPASEGREVIIRALQDAIKNGTYRVTAEQIADKMLRHLLPMVSHDSSPPEGHAE